MIELSRTGKYSLNLSLDQSGMREIKAALDAALEGIIMPVDMELARHVVGSKQSQFARTCSLIITCSEVDEIVWDAERKRLHLYLDPDIVLVSLERLAVAIETGYFYPAEFCELKIRGRAKSESLYIEVLKL